MATTARGDAPPRGDRSSNGTGSGETRGGAEGAARPRVALWLSLGLFAAALVVGFVVYTGSLRNDFVWDDPIVLGQQIHAFHSISDIFFPPPKIPQFGKLYYRPLITLTYKIDEAIWGKSALGFHLPVILLHAVNCGLVFLVGRKILGRGMRAELAAFAGAVLFALHPIHTESVCWMAGRSDTLAAVFVLPSFLAWLEWRRNGSRWYLLAAGAVLYLLGLFSKESALGLLFIMAATDGMALGVDSQRAERGAALPPRGRGKTGDATDRSTRKDRRAKSREARAGRAPATQPIPGGLIAGWAAYALATAVYFAMRRVALSVDDTPLHAQNPDPLASLLNLLRALGFYLIKILVPTHLSAYIPEYPQPALDLGIGLIGGTALVALGAMMLMRGEKVAAFLIAWFLGALAPSLSIAYFQVSKAPVAERYLYLPSVAFCLGLAYLAFVRLPSLLAGPYRRWALGAATAALTGVAIVYAAGTVQRQETWRSDFNFWTDAATKAPDQGLPHLHLGLYYEDQRTVDKAEREYNLALTLKYNDEGRAKALNNLGMLYMDEDQLDKADEAFGRAIDLSHDYPTPYYGLGITAFRRGNDALDARSLDTAKSYYAKAEGHLTRAVQLNPQYVKAYNQLSFLYYRLGRLDEAMASVNRVLQLTSFGEEHDAAVKTKAMIEQARSRSGAGQTAGSGSPSGPGG